jgi:hypothetical protein
MLRKIVLALLLITISAASSAKEQDNQYACRLHDDWLDGYLSANAKMCRKAGGEWARQDNISHANPYGKSGRVPIPRPNPFRTQ